jgi:hypothetical protein
MGSAIVQRPLLGLLEDRIGIGVGGVVAIVADIDREFPGISLRSISVQIVRIALVRARYFYLPGCRVARKEHFEAVGA